MNQPPKAPNDPFIGKETALSKQIISYFKNSKQYHLFRCNSGLVPIAWPGQPVRWMRLAPAGTPDIIGWDFELGRFIGIETKVKKNKLSKEQAEVAKQLRGGKYSKYILARSIDDVFDELEPREEMPF